MLMCKNKLKKSDIELLFKPNRLERGGLYLYSKKDSIEFVTLCIREGIRILGIDGFYITYMTTQPSNENSIDFMSSYEQQKVTAIDFFKDKHDDLFFEIIYE
jgi:hypothetical protein